MLPERGDIGSYDAGRTDIPAAVEELWIADRVPQIVH